MCYNYNQQVSKQRHILSYTQKIHYMYHYSNQGQHHNHNIQCNIDQLDYIYNHSDDR